MIDKTSGKTQEEILDQTFGNYDDEVTVNTEATSDGVKETKTVVKKSNNQNLIIGGVVGIAALGFLGFKFAGNHPQENSQSVQPVVTSVQTPVQQPVVDNASVAGNPVTPQVPVTATVVDTSDAAQYLNGNPLAPKTDIKDNVKVEVTKGDTPKVEVTQSNIKDNTKETIKINLPKVDKAVTPVESSKVETKIDVTTNPNVVTTNMSQTGLTNELKNMFDKQTLELKSSLDNVGNRVGSLEDSMKKQESVNKSIESRLANLESGKPTQVTKVVKDSEEIIDIPKKVKKHIKHKSHVHYHKMQDNSVIVDKTVTTVIIDQKVSPVYSPIELYSVFGGRVWTKNVDGSLSTYQVGDRLPSGEVIKNVDNEKFKVTTDKRVITK